MNEYTPTTEEVETHWDDIGFAGDRASFRRWLAEVERAAAEKAWVHADATITEHLVSVGSPLPPEAVTGWPANPYRRNEGANE